jgi:hypothetical protein
MNNRSFGLSGIAARTVVACALLLPGTAALAQNDAGQCSNRTLQGDFAFTVEGVFTDAPTPLAVRGVAMTHFDGQGNLSQVDHVVFNGTLPPVDWTPATGTYTINSDCTGKAQINIPGSSFSPVILRLVVADNGKLIRTVVSKPGYVVTSIGTRVH